MPGSPRQSHDDVLFQEFVILKRHFGSCRQCRIAKKTSDPTVMCGPGIRTMLQVALRIDDLITLRRKALSAAKPYIFACPDVSKHGKSYALTALPMAVTGIQDRLC